MIRANQARLLVVPRQPDWGFLSGGAGRRQYPIWGTCLPGLPQNKKSPAAEDGAVEIEGEPSEPRHNETV